MSLAISGQGATISVSVDGTTFIEVGEVKTFGGIGGGTPSVKDVTHLKSKGKEKKVGLKDEGQVTFSGNYIEDDPGQGMLENARGETISLTMKVELDNKKTPEGKGTTWVFEVFVLTFKSDGIGVDETLIFDSSCEITGSVTKTKAS
ncbi:hypothetical protein CKA55_07505 [Arcobacter suis]|uniref:Phage tail tube protein n=1 Tax=Arcobacter suis CECT 7833 TaxID=663365 RepID=A0AAD0SX07_9BACT|nr:phage tail tube protein [Arcobacter suis]AXX89342.1 hypothetical protein ASUIS_0851 [Arcobacter suis CECT 7833]RWS46576.1 hypothetical protein CKA55_07505 [Arcobacter suis]